MTRSKPSRAPEKRDYVAHWALAISGFAGLAYEIVWTRMGALALGHELPAMLAVVGGFFGGLCIGAWGTDRLVSRSAYPGRWYAGCELVIGVWSLVSMALLPYLNQQVVQWMGVAPSPARQWLLAFGVPLIALLPATVSMGATLPALERLVGRCRRDGRVVGGLYAANTFGAVAGALVATLWLIPSLGYRWTLCVLAGLNFLCAATFFIPKFRQAWPPVPEATDDLPVSGARRLYATLFLTGLFGIGYQVLAVGVMAQVTENTVYSFASALVVYLSGTAVGAAVYQRFMRNWPPHELRVQLLIALSATCVFGAIMLAKAPSIYEGVAQWAAAGSMTPLLAEAVLAAAVYAPPTVVMGATFCHLTQSARRADGGIGRALGVNTLGAALAPLIFAVLILPVLGSKWALVVASLGYLALIPSAHPRHLATALLPVGLLLALPARLMHVQPPIGGRTLAFREGMMGAAAVVSDQSGQRYLKVNNRFHMGATVNPSNERRLAHIPLLLHAKPKSALFLGIGTGCTLSAAREHPGLVTTGVELLPEVVELQPMFSSVTGELRGDKSLNVVTADARRFVRATEDRYDVIVADLFHPARDGAGGLYTLEHFRAIRGILQPSGLFCQWLPLYQMDRDTTRTILRTFLQVFPHARGYYSHLDVEKPVLGLIAWQRPTTYPADWYEMHTEHARLRQSVLECGIADGLTLFGFHLASPEQLHQLAGDGPANTDDFPIVTFRAPRFVYEGSKDTRAGLVWLLDAVAPRPEEQLTEDHSAAMARFAAGLKKHAAARDVFLRGELARANGAFREALDAYIRSAALSPDFQIGYALALDVARQNAAVGHVTQANDILQRLIAAAPDRSEARKLQAAIKQGK